MPSLWFALREGISYETQGPRGNNSSSPMPLIPPDAVYQGHSGVANSSPAARRSKPGLGHAY